MAIKQSNQFAGILHPDMVKGFRVVCEKHGDVTGASCYFDYKVLDKENNKSKNYQSIYCIPCLNEYLMSLQEEGKIPKVMLYEVDEPVEKENGEAEETTEEKAIEQNDTPVEEKVEEIKKEE